MAESSKSSQVRRLLGVLFLGVATAAIISYFFLSHYGPSGQYVAKNVLLSPEMLDQLNFYDRDLATGGTNRYVFHSIEFVYFDEEQKEWKRVNVDKERYQKFYQFLSNDVSLSEASDAEKSFFQKSLVSSLILTVRSDSSGKGQIRNKVFQEVNFAANKNYYRVELHDENASMHWAYFKHPHIYQHIFALFVP